MEQEEKKQEPQKYKEPKQINWGLWIGILFFISIFVGIRIYTRILERKNAAAIERIMQKNIEDHGTPFFEH